MVDETPQKLGRYEVTRCIGKGAMGVVYEGRDPVIGRRVAIKMCRQDVMESSGLKGEMLARFSRELRAAGALQHPNIITIYDVGEQDGAAYIAMEYIEGGDLRQAMEAREQYELPRLVEICAEVCEALHAAHRQGIIHRDVKPANVLLPEGGGVKVADFGIARVPNSELTIDGAIVGTPHYMSPEQFSGDPLDGRSDLFSVGIILYELLTGQKPFPGEALSTVMHHVLRREPVKPSTANPALPVALDTVMLKSLAKKPEDRYADGKVMAAALREALKESPDAEVLAGGAPRKAPTVMGGARPMAPEPAKAFPMVDSKASTISPAAPAEVLPVDTYTSSLMWPAIAVGLFAALIVIALALKVQVGSAPAGQGTASQGAVVQGPLLVVWGADTASARAKVASAATPAEIAAIQGQLDAAVAAELHPIAATLKFKDLATKQTVGQMQVTAAGAPLDLPTGYDAVTLEVSAPGYEAQSFPLKREGGTVPLPVVVLVKEAPRP